MTEPIVQRLPAEPDLVMLDLDGVAYHGEQAVPGAAEAIRGFAHDGLPYAFLTNNASRSAAAVARQLGDHGIPAAPSQVLTSGVACARQLAAQLPAGARVGVLGSHALLSAVKEAGLHAVPAAKLPTQYPPGNKHSAPAAVVMGFSPDTSVADLQRAIAAVRAGAQYWATNPDPAVPKETGQFPGNGTFTGIVADFTGCAPLVSGKPAAVMPRSVINEFQATAPVMVGDRCDTDIAAGHAAGCAAVLVLTGIDDVHAAVTAPAQSRPDRIIAGLSDLRHPMPAVRLSDDNAECGTGTASLEATGPNNARLHVSGPPELAVHAALALVGSHPHTAVDPGNLPRRFESES